MCKCCQNCLESIYWHCFEKWFCWDESIALWEDTDQKPNKTMNDQLGWDNMAYWDSIAVIANRSIVTIQPLSESKSTPDIPQLNELSTSLSVQDDLHRRLSEVFMRSSLLKDTPPNTTGSSATISNNSEPIEIKSNYCSSCSNNKINNDKAFPVNQHYFTPLKDQYLAAKGALISEDSGIEDNEYNVIKEHEIETKPNLTIPEQNTNQAKSDSNIPETLKAIEKTQETHVSSDFLAPPPPAKKRPSLHKAESTRFFSLDPKPFELRLIKQNSMPNFYAATPTISDVAPPSFYSGPDKILMSPILPNAPTFKYDLRSIVEIENSRAVAASGSSEAKVKTSSQANVNDSQKSSRLISIRKKIAPLIIKRPSNINLNSSK